MFLKIIHFFHKNLKLNFFLIVKNRENSQSNQLKSKESLTARITWKSISQSAKEYRLEMKVKLKIENLFYKYIKFRKIKLFN